VNPSNALPWQRWQLRGLIVGVAGLLLCAAVAVFAPEVFYRAYLAAFICWLGIPLGSLAILMLHNLTGGGWGRALRPVLEAATGTLLLMAALFTPLLAGLSELYLWARPEAVAADRLLLHKSQYLNIPFFLGRVGAYFLLWLFLSFILNRWMTQRDRENDNSRLARRLRLISGPGLLVYGLTVTFAAIDWVMSLQPHWVSSIFPVIIAVGQVLAAFAFSIAILGLLARRGESLRIPADLSQNLGNLLLAFVMLWAYVSFSQFLLIWSGNLPEEVEWYHHRLRGGWEGIALLLVVCQFALPFLLLLSRGIKREPRTLALVALLVLLLRLPEAVWQVLPAFPPESLTYHLADMGVAVLALVGIGGLWSVVFLGQLKRKPLEAWFAALPREEAHHGGE
jgi:hypothetical protein